MLPSRFSRTTLLAAACFAPLCLHAQTELPAAPEPTAVTLARLSPPEPIFSSSIFQQQQPTLQQKPTEPSLDDLGLNSKPDPDAQHRLDTRTRDLKIHQTLGIVTLAPLAAACITSALAPPDFHNGGNNSTGRDIHVAMGSLSVAMYGATAYYAIKAPRIAGQGPTKGGIKLHKYLIYIHAPGMILTPILGALAYEQASNGEKVHGIASAHAAVAWTTVATYSASIIAVSWPLHFPGHHS